MNDPYYPTVDIEFLIEQVKLSGKLTKDGILKIGSTTTFILEGMQPSHRRSISVRELEPGEICLEQASSLAIRFAFLGNFLDWLYKNKNWKEGGYIVPKTESI